MSQQMQQDEFRNESFTDFSKEENARAMREAVERVKSELGREYPLVIGGERADETFKTWRNTPPEERAGLLFRVAGMLRERRHYFSAWMVHEVAKTWAEADGDTAEAIDFCEFYAREMLRYAGPQPLTKIDGEENRLEYIPLGVGCVIPPWNFPLAIMAGDTAG